MTDFSKAIKWEMLDKMSKEQLITLAKALGIDTSKVEDKKEEK